MAEYTYWINFNKASPSWSEFWPNKEAKLLKKRPANQEFYREECDELKIKRTRENKDNSTVYDTLETWFSDATKFSDEIEIEIYRGDRTGTIYFAGYFSICDATPDNEYKTFKINPLIDDAYRPFVDGGEAEYDLKLVVPNDEDVIIGSLQSIGAWIAKGPLTPLGSYNDFDTFTVGATNNILTSVIDIDAVNQEARHQSIGAVTNGKKIIIKITSFTLNVGTGPYIDIVNAGENSITAEGGAQIVANATIELTINSTTTGYLMIYTSPGNQFTNFALTISYLIDEGTVYSSSAELFIDYIEKFITHASFMNLTGYVGNVKSTYLNNDAVSSDVPSSINTFLTSFPGSNYASEQKLLNPLNGLLVSLTQTWVTANVNNNFMSFNQIMNDLFQFLQAGWYIDADGDFRIEHVKWFELLTEDSTAIDLTGAAYDKYKVEIDSKELVFNKGLLANREQFRWQQNDTIANSEDFVGVDIIYDNLETISNVLKHEARIITTDLQYMLDNPGDASADGLTYLVGVVLPGGDYIIEFEEGVLSTNDVLNGHLSWANLQDLYWTWRRMSENGDMNNGATTFDSAVKFLEQAGVKFGYQSTLSGFTKITTSQGTGQQAETIRDLDSDFLTMLIRFNPYA